MRPRRISSRIPPMNIRFMGRTMHRAEEFCRAPSCKRPLIVGLRIRFLFDYFRGVTKGESCRLMKRPSKYLLCRKLGMFFTTTLWLLLAATAQADEVVPLSAKVITVAGS